MWPTNLLTSWKMPTIQGSLRATWPNKSQWKPKTLICSYEILPQYELISPICLFYKEEKKFFLNPINLLLFGKLLSSPDHSENSSTGVLRSNTEKNKVSLCDHPSVRNTLYCTPGKHSSSWGTIIHTML